MNILEHKFIIFCQDHYNPLTLIRSIGVSGIKPIVILVGNNPYLINHSKYVGVLHIVGNNDEGYELLMKKYGNERVKPFLFTASDDIESYLDLRYDELIDKFIFFDGGEAGRITHFMDKAAISDLAEKIGFRVPKAEVLDKGQLPVSVPYPVMTKAINSTVNHWKDDVFICNSPDELKDAYKEIRSNPVMVEEYIRKKNELCVDGISIDGGKEVYMPYKVHYIRMSEKSYGNYMDVLPFEDYDVKRKIQRLIEATGFSGIFSIEFLVTEDDDLVFLEVNFRHSTWASSSLYGGANLPILWAEGMLSGRLNVEELTLRHEPFRAMSELGDFNDSVRSGKVSLSQWIRDFRSCECPFIYASDDKKPAIYTFIRLASGFLKRRVFRRK